MEPKRGIDELLKQHLSPPEEGLPPLRTEIRQLVARRQKADPGERDLFMRIAFFLNEKIKLRHAVVLLTAITGLIVLSRGQTLPQRKSNDDSRSTTFYANSSVSSNTVLSSIYTSRVTKNSYDGNNRN